MSLDRASERVILNLRGTSGSGKSTIVRRVMECYKVSPCYQLERRQPLAYIGDRDPGAALFVPGHYETPCGGCDTIKTVDEVYHLVEQGIAYNRDVIYEGIMVQDDVKRCAALHRRHPLTVIALTTPIDVCLASVQKRRDERGDERPLNPKNTISRAERVKRNAQRLRGMGVPVLFLDRDAALQFCLEALNLVSS